MAKTAVASKLLQSEVTRFILSAGVGFLVDVSSFYLFYHNLLTKKKYFILFFTVRNYWLSFSISFFLGVLVNFLITRYFVFTKSTTKPVKQFVRFVSVAVVGYFANLTLLTVFVADLNVYPPVARVIAALSLFFASFFVHKVFSFSLSLRHHSPGKPMKS